MTRNNHKIDITIDSDTLMAIAQEMRRIPPRDHETDNFIAATVHWFEGLARPQNG